MGVGIVFVSHSAGIAEGLVELAAQMAPTVALAAAGGTDDGGIGTSYEKVTSAIAQVDGGDGVLLIGDLGSAILTAETAVDLLDEPPVGGITVLDVPLVEGGVAAAVAAEAGVPLDAVVAAAAGDVASPAPSEAASATGTAVLADPDGLHARPAALLVRAAAGYASRITVDGADAASLLAVLAKGLRQGAAVDVRAEGPDARAAVDAVVALLERS